MRNQKNYIFAHLVLFLYCIVACQNKKTSKDYVHRKSAYSTHTTSSTPPNNIKSQNHNMGPIKASYAPSQENTNNIHVSAPAQENTNNIHVSTPSQENTNNINISAPSQENTNNINIFFPAKKNSNSINISAPSQENTNNINISVPAKKNSNNINVSAPSQKNTNNINIGDNIGTDNVNGLYHKKDPDNKKKEPLFYVPQPSVNVSSPNPTLSFSTVPETTNLAKDGTKKDNVASDSTTFPISSIHSASTPLTADATKQENIKQAPKRLINLIRQSSLKTLNRVQSVYCTPSKDDAGTSKIRRSNSLSTPKESRDELQACDGVKNKLCSSTNCGCKDPKKCSCSKEKQPLLSNKNSKIPSSYASDDVSTYVRTDNVGESNPKTHTLESFTSVEAACEDNVASDSTTFPISSIHSASTPLTADATKQENIKQAPNLIRQSSLQTLNRVQSVYCTPSKDDAGTSKIRRSNSLSRPKESRDELQACDGVKNKLCSRTNCGCKDPKKCSCAKEKQPLLSNNNSKIPSSYTSDDVSTYVRTDNVGESNPKTHTLESFTSVEAACTEAANSQGSEKNDNIENNNEYDNIAYDVIEITIQTKEMLDGNDDSYSTIMDEASMQEEFNKKIQQLNIFRKYKEIYTESINITPPHLISLESHLLHKSLSRCMKKVQRNICSLLAQDATKHRLLQKHKQDAPEHKEDFQKNSIQEDAAKSSSITVNSYLEFGLSETEVYSSYNPETSQTLNDVAPSVISNNLPPTDKEDNKLEAAATLKTPKNDTQSDVFSFVPKESVLSRSERSSTEADDNAVPTPQNPVNATKDIAPYADVQQATAAQTSTKSKNIPNAEKAVDLPTQSFSDQEVQTRSKDKNTVQMQRSASLRDPAETRNLQRHSSVSSEGKRPKKNVLFRGIQTITKRWSLSDSSSTKKSGIINKDGSKSLDSFSSISQEDSSDAEFSSLDNFTPGAAKEEIHVVVSQTVLASGEEVSNLKANPKVKKMSRSASLHDRAQKRNLKLHNDLKLQNDVSSEGKQPKPKDGFLYTMAKKLNLSTSSSKKNIDVITTKKDGAISLDGFSNTVQEEISDNYDLCPSKDSTSDTSDTSNTPDTPNSPFVLVGMESEQDESKNATQNDTEMAQNAASDIENLSLSRDTEVSEDREVLGDTPTSDDITQINDTTDAEDSNIDTCSSDTAEQTS